MRKLILAAPVSFMAAFAAALPFGAHEAQAEIPAFTADVVQTTGPGGMQAGTVTVAGDNLRYEFRHGPRKMVQIVNAKADSVSMLMPEMMKFMTWPKGGAELLPGRRPATPCAALPKGKCNMLGKEKFGSRNAETWRYFPNNLPISVKIWWDPERRFALREEYSDGRVTSANLEGEIKYEGRPVERWTTNFMLPTGRMRQSERLYDKELGLVISEIRFNGMMRQYHNIRIVEPDAGLFEIPKDYEKFDPKTDSPMAHMGQMHSQMHPMHPMGMAPNAAPKPADEKAKVAK